MGEKYGVQRQDTAEQTAAKVGDNPLARLGHIEVAQGRHQTQAQGIHTQNHEPEIQVLTIVIKAMINGTTRRRRQAQRGSGRDQKPEGGEERIQSVLEQIGQQPAQRLDAAGLGPLAAGLAHLLGQERPGTGSTMGRTRGRRITGRLVCHDTALAPKRPAV